MSGRSRSSARWSAAVADAVQTRLWPVPVAAILLSLAGAVALTRLDQAVDADLPAAFSRWVFGGDASAARSVLSSIATALMTVTSLTFSLTVVTLQLASSQYSPRLLRTFTQAAYVQRTLALFLGTFVYTLTVLRSVRSAESGSAEVVPEIAITLSFALTVASVIGLVVFLAQLAENIRVEKVLETVHDESVATIRRSLTDLTTLRSHLERPAAGTVRLCAPRSGFVTTVEVDRLVDAARSHGAVLLIEVPVGASVVAGTTIGHAWSADGSATPGPDVRDALQEAVDRGVKVGRERTSVDDSTFGLQQITDVAVRALSPGTNDPTTATHALARSSAVLCQLVTLPLGDVVCTDDDGVRRLVVRQADLRDALRLALGEPRHFGIDDPQVTERLFQLLREVAESCTDAEERRAVREELDQTVRAREQVSADPVVRRRLADAAAAAYAALDRSGGA